MLLIGDEGADRYTAATYYLAELFKHAVSECFFVSGFMDPDSVFRIH